MLTSKQRAFLRGRASTLETILLVGKDGVTENTEKQANDALTAREIIKGKVLETCMFSANEVVRMLAEACNAEPVCAIGSKFVLYRENTKLAPEKRITLP